MRRWMGVLPGYYFGRNTLTGTVGYADRGPFVVHQRNDFNMTMQIANHLLHHRGIDGPAQGPVRRRAFRRSTSGAYTSSNCSSSSSSSAAAARTDRGYPRKQQRKPVDVRTWEDVLVKALVVVGDRVCECSCSCVH